MLALTFVANSVAAQPRYETKFTTIDVQGWHVNVRASLSANKPTLRKATLDALEAKFAAIAAVVPEPALTRIRTIAIWVDSGSPNPGAMQYQMEREWLSAHGFDPEEAGGVEISHPELFLSALKDRPWLVLHELAYAYYDKVLGIGDGSIRAAFLHAKRSNLYKNIQHRNGSVADADAITNEQEYFAELSEAYFGENPTYPFTASDLRSYDPVGYRTIGEAWARK